MKRLLCIPLFVLLAFMLAELTLPTNSAVAQKKETQILKWEYKVVSPSRSEEGAIQAGGSRPIDADKLEKALNDLGNEGWECVATVNDVRGGASTRANNTDVLLILKRPKK